MEEFLPSEVARAVYGYLLSEGCEDAAKTFLETSPSLVECKQRVKHGKRLTHANTLLLGKNLIEVLNIACSVHSIVKQIHDKQQRGIATDNHESLTELLDQLRSCMLSDTRIEENSSQTLMQPEPQGSISSPYHLRTTPNTAVSLAENYRSLVQECSEGLDLSLSPEKTAQKNKNAESPCRQSLNRPTSAPGALGVSQLDMDNESAIEAITGISITPSAASVASNGPQIVAISSSSLPPTVGTTTLYSSIGNSVMTSSTVVVATAVSSVTTSSHQATDRPQPAASQSNRVISAESLPDPPIIVLNSQNQSLEGGDTSATYFNLPPCAASTPQSRSAFMPEDTAFIIYPPLTTDPKPKKLPLKEKTNLRRSGRLRKLLPKPLRKDPPHVIHVKVLPQTIDEEDEEDTDEVDEMELAQRLSNSEDKIIPEDKCERSVEKEGGIEEEKNIEVVATTSDKENVSDENIPRGELLEKPSNNVATECGKETSTPRPPLRKNISRSTPRRNSHVRALSFNTPHKPTISRKSNTSPKMPKIKFSPRSAKLSCVKRSSLFSPQNDKELSHVSEEDVETNHGEEDQEEIDKEKHQAMLENSPLYKVPIATRSPAPKLSSAWQEVNDVKITENPVWDEQIRNFALGDFEDPAPPPKKGPPEKQQNIDISPNKVNKVSPKKANNQSLTNEVQILCPKKSGRSKKGSCTPLKSPGKNKIIEHIEPLDMPQKKKNTLVKSSNRKTLNKKNKCSPLKKTKSRRSVLNSKEKSTSYNTKSNTILENEKLFVDPQISEEDKIGKVSESPKNVEHEVEVNEKMQENNILLEDLVLSSNSCFPQTNDDIRSESSNVKESTSQLHDENKTETSLQPNILDNTTVKTNSTNSSSATFIPPNVLVLETPSKDFQACDPKLFALTTPLIKSIRQETSILEEDLLLTPSLPPTPQINSSPRNLLKTPCKTVIGSPNGNKAQTSLPSVLKENESKLTLHEKLGQSPSKEKVDLSSMTEKGNILSNSESETEGYKGIVSSLPTMQSHPSPENIIVHGSVQSNCRPPMNSSTDTSEDEIGSNANHSECSLSKSKIIVNENIKKNKMRNVARNRIYSTTESSDNETNDKKGMENSCPVKTKLSKLASVLLENERKSLNQKTKKLEAKKKVRLSNNNSLQRSSGSISSLNSSQDTKKSTKRRKKDAKQTVIGGRSSSEIKEKSPKINSVSQGTLEKQVTPENLRQQLQSDLLKHERKIIFGEGFAFTSDTESEIEVFEKKKKVENKPKLKKCPPKKKTFDDILLSEDSSVDNTIDCSKTGKCVRFETPGISLRSPDKKQIQFLKRSSEMSYIKGTEKSECQEVNVNNPSKLPESSETLENLDQAHVSQNKISDISVTSNLNQGSSEINSHQSVSVSKTLNESRSNGQNTSTINCNALDTNSLFEKTPLDKMLNQSQTSAGLESSFCFKNNIPNKCSMGIQVRQTVNKANDSLDETSLADTNRSNTSENKTNINMEHCNSIREESQNPRSPTDRVDCLYPNNNSKQTEGGCPQKDNKVDENEICITSTSERINATSLLDRLDLNRKDTFQVDEGKVTLSYSHIIKHYYYSPILSDELVQSENKEHTQPNSNQKNDFSDKRVTFKEQTVKRRIKLIPIEDDKYEQKLQVDYDFIDDDNVIINRGNRRLSSEIDILDCSTSSILSDTGCVKKQSLVFIRNHKDSNVSMQEIVHKNQGGKLDKVKNSNEKINTGVNEMNMKVKSSSRKEIFNDHPLQTQEKLPDDVSKHKKYIDDKGISCQVMNESRSRSQRSHHSRHQYERKALYEGGRNRARQENESSSQSRRRDRNEYNRKDQSYNRRHYDRRYSERWRRETDRRGFSEKRNHFSRSYSRRSSPSDPQTSRHDPKIFDKTSDTEHNDKTIEKLKKTLSQKEKHDLDRVDKLEKSTVGVRCINQEKADPRAAQVLTYSDVERNESSRDEADSLMDFAVITKTTNQRLPVSPTESPPVLSISVGQDPSNSSKRKASNNIGESLEACHVEKKLKLGEVEMKEAKSVLKHKMADMLNALHPDTSNEAS